ncbi:hypothetical protein, partial [Streptomyces katrae]|uniref:hypothetical protein n=1 Tax=Streptomyces katrae TaxID=68223 RepID=UPI0012FEAB49
SSPQDRGAPRQPRRRRIQDRPDRRGGIGRSRTTQRYNARKELLDDSPGYTLGADVASALAHIED